MKSVYKTIGVYPETYIRLKGKARLMEVNMVTLLDVVSKVSRNKLKKILLSKI